MRLVGLILLFALSAHAYEPYLLHRRKAFRPASAGSSVSYIVKQGFEGVGYDNGETWTESGAVNEDATTVAFEGTHAFHFPVNAFAYNQFTAASTVYGFGMLYLTNLPSASRAICSFVTAADGNCINIQVRTSGALQFTHGSSGSGNTVGTVSLNTWTYVWWTYIAGTGANGYGEVCFSTDGTKPTSGNNFVSMNNANGTASAERIKLGRGSTAHEGYWDKVRVDDVAIGSNPE